MCGLCNPGRGVGLAAEPLFERRVLGQMRWQHLERDDPVGAGVEGPPHLTHPAAANGPTSR